jgi:hypothetical protein
MRLKPTKDTSGIVRGLRDRAKITGEFEISQRHTVNELEHHERRTPSARGWFYVQHFWHWYLTTQQLEHCDFLCARRAVVIVQPENNRTWRIIDEHATIAIHEAAGEQLYVAHTPAIQPRRKHRLHVARARRSDVARLPPTRLLVVAVASKHDRMPFYRPVQHCVGTDWLTVL